MVKCDKCKKKIEPDMEAIYPYHMLKRIIVNVENGSVPMDVCEECFKNEKGE